MRVFLSVVLSLGVVVAASPLELEKRGKAKLITKCIVPNTVALTFDDGPYIYLEDVVNALKGANAKGTFFFNGDNYGCIYDEAMVTRVKYAYNNGFQVGSHTWAHKDLTTLSNDQINSEMARTEEAIQKITGVIPAYTRPPTDLLACLKQELNVTSLSAAYGNTNDNVLNVAGSRGQTLVNWDFDSGDSTGSTVAEQKQAYTDLVNDHPSTILSLEHEVYESTAHEVLPFVISKLQGAGYKLVTLAECLNTSPYLKTGAASARDASWTC